MKFVFFKKSTNLLKFVNILIFLEKTFTKQLASEEKSITKYSTNFNYKSFHPTTQLFTKIIKFSDFLENLISFLATPNRQFSSKNIFKICKKIFIKIKNIKRFSEKTTYLNFRYFWIFKKKGYYWKRNYIFYKTKKFDDSISNFKLSKIFLKFNFIKRLKIFWKLNMKMKMKKKEKRKKIIKKKKFWSKRKTFLKYSFIWEFYVTFFKNTVFIIVFLMIVSFKQNKKKIFTKNFHKARLKEKNYLLVRKKFQAYYVFRTFEYAFHNYWTLHKYYNLLNFYKNYFLKNGVNNDNGDKSTLLLTQFFSRKININKLFLRNLINFFKKNLNWRRQRKLLVKDDRGYFSWKNRRNKKKKKFKKSFSSKSLFSKSFFFQNNFFSSGVVNLSQNLIDGYSHQYNYVLPNFFKKSSELINFFYFSKFFNGSLVNNTFFLNLRKKWTLSNYNLVVFFPQQVKKFFLKKKILLKKFINHKYLQFYLNNFINYYSSMKSFFMFFSNLNKFYEKFSEKYIYLSNEIVHFFKQLNKKFFKNFLLGKFIEFFSFSLFKKDLNFFIKFFKLLLENVFLKKHKKILYTFDFILKKFLKKIFFYTNVRGFRFEMAGKISVTGNSKTRKKIINFGSYSLTNKSLKINYIQDIVRTSTGVLGVKSYLTY